MLLHQEKAVRKFIESIGMGESAPVKTPMQVGLALEEPSKIVMTADDKSFPYQSAVGKLIWLLGVRMDCSFAINVATRYMGSWDGAAIGIVKRIAKYLVGKEKHGLIYRRDQNGAKIENARMELSRFKFYGDSDHGSRLYDSKSTAGGSGFYGNNQFTYYTKAQDVGVATSTCQAEAGAAKLVCQLTEWVLGLSIELRVRGQGPVTIYQDNKSVIELSKNPVMHKRSKHFRVAIHYIQDLAERMVIKLEYVETVEMLADVLTKALHEPAFVKLLQLASFGAM